VKFASMRSTNLVLLGSLLALLACGSEEPESARTAVQAVPTADTRRAVPHAAPRELPETLPAGLPLLPGAEMKKVSPPVDGGIALGFEVAGSVSEVVADYTELLEADGWVVVSSDSPEGWVIVAQKPGATAMASIVEGGAGVVVDLVVAELE